MITLIVLGWIAFGLAVAALVFAVYRLIVWDELVWFLLVLLLVAGGAFMLGAGYYVSDHDRRTACDETNHISQTQLAESVTLIRTNDNIPETLQQLENNDIGDALQSYLGCLLNATHMPERSDTKRLDSVVNHILDRESKTALNERGKVLTDWDRVQFSRVFRAILGWSPLIEEHPQTDLDSNTAGT